jgi:hypothetical protein
MKTRYREAVGRIVGAVVGFGFGIALFALISRLFHAGPNPIMFYIAGFVFGAGGAGGGGRLMVRLAGKVQITRGVYITAPGWKETARGPKGVTLAKGDGRLEIEMVEGEGTATPAMVLERYGERKKLTLGEDPAPVEAGASAVGVGTGERRSFTATLGWPPDEARENRRTDRAVEGELTAFVIQGVGLVFHSSAPSGWYATIGPEIHEAIGSLERQ